MSNDISIALITKSVKYECADLQQLTDAIDFEVEMALSADVTDQASYEEAVASMNRFSKFAKTAEAYRKSAVKPIDDAKKEIQAQFKPLSERVKSAIDHLKGRIAAYSAEQERKQRELQMEAERKAREQREAMLKAAESAKDEEEKALIRESAEMVTAPKIEVPATQKVSGVSFSRKWKARITNQELLLKHIAEHPEFSEWVEFKTSKMDAYARATNGIAKVPGLEFYQDSIVSSRSL